MDLWLFRHAVAEDRAQSGWDPDRALTPDGLRRAQAVARGLAALERAIERVISSPYRRALQSARPAAEALGLRVTESDALEPDRDPEEILREVAAEGSHALLVGHQPHLGSLLGLLLAGPRVEIPMKKASIARVSIDGRWSGTLRAYLPPGILETLGEE